MSKVLIGIPSGANRPFEFSANFHKFLLYQQEKGLIGAIAEFQSVRGDRNRNEICKKLLEQPDDVQAVFFVEEDHIYPHAAIEVMLRCHADIVCGFYVHRTFHWPQLFEYSHVANDPIDGLGVSHRPLVPETLAWFERWNVPEAFRETAYYLEGIPDSEAYLDIKAGGTGFMLVRRAILEKMKAEKRADDMAWFGRENGTEGDLMFFRRAIEAGAVIKADMRLGASHLTLLPMGLPQMRDKYGKLGQVSVLIPTTDAATSPRMAVLAKKVIDTAGVPCQVTVLPDTEREGYVQNVNNGIRVAEEHGASFICVLVDDCNPVQDRWLARLLQPLFENREAWASGPTINCTLPQRDPANATGAWQEVGFLSGSCFVMRSGYQLDERFTHYYGDVDMFLRMGRDGKKLIWCAYTAMGGHAPSTQDEEWKGSQLEQWWQRDEALYREIWEREAVHA